MYKCLIKTSVIHSIKDFDLIQIDNNPKYNFDPIQIDNNPKYSFPFFLLCLQSVKEWLIFESFKHNVIGRSMIVGSVGRLVRGPWVVG